jgi:hypothetical protein
MEFAELGEGMQEERLSQAKGHSTGTIQVLEDCEE